MEGTRARSRSRSPHTRKHEAVIESGPHDLIARVRGAPASSSFITWRLSIPGRRRSRCKRPRAASTAARTRGALRRMGVDQSGLDTSSGARPVRSRPTPPGGCASAAAEPTFDRPWLRAGDPSMLRAAYRSPRAMSGGRVPPATPHAWSWREGSRARCVWDTWDGVLGEWLSAGEGLVSPTRRHRGC